ncbi:MAG TPA: malto-oligosyltrehalose trehalohydrolase [Bryobacteraceae bacterium]|nr:malto-oligosyltrehalose trehalohydrolase [Bryobacteraceae bacterium]
MNELAVETTFQRRLQHGAECLRDGGVHFRVWAPGKRKVEVLIGGTATLLAPDRDGYHSGIVPGAGPGTLYKYRLDGSDAFPDPASRFQPQGPHGPSEVIDTAAFRWRDARWGGITIRGQVIYEMHVGTFTPEGTWRAALAHLPALADLGVTVLEVMPIAEFPGRFGWGYDGVDLFAPYHVYGRPEDLCEFVNRAHELGLAVILDVVYNHLGPDGNYLAQYSREYSSTKHVTEWGEAINFDGTGSRPVREFYADNAAFWVSEYHLDGLRLDATQSIFDDSPEHILRVVGRRVREAAAGRGTIVVAENEPQETRLVRPVQEGGYRLDGLWNDDFHHSAMVALTGHNDAYYTDYLGAPQEFISAVKYGYLYQGQRYKWQKKRRGTPAFGIPSHAFITFIQNHDQVANSAHGERIHKLTSPGRLRAVTALMLLAPGTPMLFQGQEFAASAPFLYFADHEPRLAELVARGRREFLEQWRRMKTPEVQARFSTPNDPQTFERCKLDWGERERHRSTLDLYRDLLRLRREDAAFSMQAPGHVDGAVLAAHAFVLRFFAADDGDRLLLVNLGQDLHLDPAPEPLLAPPKDMQWEILFSTEDPRYGGCGTAAVDSDENWRVPGEAAVVLRPAPLPAKPQTLHKKDE